MRLDAQLARTLEPVRGRPYLLFHDAFHYFEARYGSRRWRGDGRIRPAAWRAARGNLAREDQSGGAICVFSTPQFSPRLLPALTEGSPARSAVLDDLGRTSPGPGFTRHSLPKSRTASILPRP